MAHSDTMPTSTRLELLEKVNRLNIEAHLDDKAFSHYTFWTVTVLYNTVIYKCDSNGNVEMHEVIEGVPK